jgi:3-methyladenine DNA glycosylase/8-oxoguanine DNA glycosylase
MHFTLAANSPFIFYTTVHSHGWYQLAPSLWDEETRVLRRAERLSSGRVISLALSGAEGGVRVQTPKLDAREEDELRARLSWMFWLDADFSAFYDRADAEPLLRHVREKAQGRMLRSTSMFEDVAKMMMTTNIQWSGTKRLTQALVDHFGEPAEDDAAQRAFPTPVRIARSRESTLRNVGLGYRAPYLLKLARDVASGHVDLDELKDRSLPTLEVRKRLIALPGIGPYAAAALLTLLGRHDFIPIDTEAVAAVSKHFYGGRKVGEKEIIAVFEHWGEHKALAYWFWNYDG